MKVLLSLLFAVVILSTQITSYCEYLLHEEKSMNSIIFTQNSVVGLVISSQQASDIANKSLFDEFQVRDLYPIIQLKSCKLLYDQTRS